MSQNRAFHLWRPFRTQLYHMQFTSSCIWLKTAKISSLIPATFFKEITTNSPLFRWGFAPPEWQSSVGNVLLVRKDRKNLSREHARALAEYVRYPVIEAFTEIEDVIPEQQRRGIVLKTLNWGSFEAWLEEFKKEVTAVDGDTRADITSPFGAKERSLRQ